MFETSLVLISFPSLPYLTQSSVILVANPDYWVMLEKLTALHGNRTSQFSNHWSIRFTGRHLENILP